MISHYGLINLELYSCVMTCITMAVLALRSVCGPTQSHLFFQIQGYTIFSSPACLCVCVSVCECECVNVSVSVCVSVYGCVCVSMCMGVFICLI